MADAPGARISHPREWVINIKRELEPYIKTTTSRKQKRPILRVGTRLRELRREKFVPQHLFLGLYKGSSFDHNDPKKRGNIFRLAVVGAFLGDSRLAINDWENISARIVKDPKAMLEKYNEDGLDDFSTEDVQSVLSLDAIFLAWFCSEFICASIFPSTFRAQFPSVFYVLRGEDLTFVQEIILDILKLENQIPLELIHNALFLFYEIANGKRGNQGLESKSNSQNVGDAQTQADRALQIICYSVATCCDDELPGSKDSGSNLKFDDNCEHFLHCAYLNLRRDESDQSKPRTHQDTHAAPYSHRSCVQENPLASASQLGKVGIKFRGQEGLEVKFERHFLGATLYLPKINYIGDSAEGTWRNLLAFEDQYGSEEHPFKSYLFFMDELVDVEEDVILLRSGKHPVIVNVGLGTNEEVAKMFNSMTTHYYDESSEKWVSVRMQILDYYNSKTRQTWDEFRRTNFGKPWLFASFLAACALLVMTLLQTLFAILTYKYTF